jgi:hypothetical protein
MIIFLYPQIYYIYLHICAFIRVNVTHACVDIYLYNTYYIYIILHHTVISSIYCIIAKHSVYNLYMFIHTIQLYSYII